MKEENELDKFGKNLDKSGIHQINRLLNELQKSKEEEVRERAIKLRYYLFNQSEDEHAENLMQSSKEKDDIDENNIGQTSNYYKVNETRWDAIMAVINGFDPYKHRREIKNLIKSKPK